MGISSHSQLLSLSQETNQTLKTIIMNAFAFIILSLAAIATAAPGGCRGKRSPGWGCNNKSSGGASSRGAPALKSIAGTAAATPALSTLFAAVKAAGLAPTLSGKGDFTVFAPVNEAFDKLPEGTIPTLLKPENKDQLAAILLRHVLPNRIMAADIPRGTTKVKTVGGEEIEVINNGSGVSIRSSAGSARVIKTDILTSNGVVHLVDTVF